MRRARAIESEVIDGLCVLDRQSAMRVSSANSGQWPECPQYEVEPHGSCASLSQYQRLERTVLVSGTPTTAGRADHMSAEALTGPTVLALSG